MEDWLKIIGLGAVVWFLLSVTVNLICFVAEAVKITINMVRERRRKPLLGKEFKIYLSEDGEDWTEVGESADLSSKDTGLWSFEASGAWELCEDDDEELTEEEEKYTEDFIKDALRKKRE